MTNKKFRRIGSTYREAGVDLEASDRALSLIKERVRTTFRPEVLGDIGGFGGFISIDMRRYREPVLVSGTDGVGTKLVIAQRMGIHDTVGIDLVAMCADDVVAHGAEPLFFQDYIAMGKVNERVVAQLLDGMVGGCKEAGCSLNGGEIAEHPGVMRPDEYDLAGFCVGVVDRSKLITGKDVAKGDVVIGVESSGLHSNGFSLVRKVLLEEMGFRLEDQPMELTTTLGEELLRPTTIYTPAMLALFKDVEVKGVAHITGGGIPGNLQRIVPESLGAVVESATWEPPPIFRLITNIGKVESEEMFATFNMGIGMCVVVGAESANKALDSIRSHGHRAHEIGLVEKYSSGSIVRIV